MYGGTEGKVSKAHFKQLTSGEVFGPLRILVIGRPHSGKSTLIKLLLGLQNGQGPEKGSKYDIATEWSHPTVQLKIHVCDVSIAPPPVVDPNTPKPGLVKRVLKRTRRSSSDPDLKEVEVFLKARQKKSEFSERVHLVWFVVSALDAHNALNAKILTEIGSHKDLPVLLIVTHNDGDPGGLEYSRNVEAHLTELLEGVSTREKVLDSIVKVRNDVDHNGIDNSALTMLSVKTLEQLHRRELKGAWTAAQVVDVREKIRLSAKKIVGFKEAAIWASPAGLIPGHHQSNVGSLLTGLCRALCLIWGVPKTFKKSLKRNLASQEVYNMQIQLLLEKFAAMGNGGVGLGSFAGQAGRVMTTAVTTSISESLSCSITLVAVAAAGVGWVYGSRNDAYNSMIAMVSLGMMVTGAILHVKALYDPRGWDESRSKKDYDKLIKEFVDLHGPDLKQNIGKSQSVGDVFNPEMDRHQIMKQLVDYFARISAQQPAVHNSEPVAHNNDHD